MNALKKHIRFYYAVKKLRKFGFKLDFKQLDKYRILRRSDNSTVEEVRNLTALEDFVRGADHKHPIKLQAPRMPRKLTAENGAKARLIGEFQESIEDICTECCGRSVDSYGDDCEECDGVGAVVREIPVQWTTIKEIYRKIVEDVEKGYIKADL